MTAFYYSALQWKANRHRRPTGFVQCFDTVSLVIWPVKIVPEMTYNVLSGTLSLYTATAASRLIQLIGYHTV